MKQLKIISIVILPILLNACVTNHNKNEMVGGAIGAVAGGVIGSQIGKGHGNTAAIILGTATGTFLGQYIGSRLDRIDRYHMQSSLNTKTGQSYSWQNPNTGNHYTIIPEKPFMSANDYPCRSYTIQAEIDGHYDEVIGEACYINGQWVQQ